MEKELAKKILELNKLFQEVNHLVMENYDEVDDMFDYDYPFTQSFDEVAEEVSTWAESVKNRIK